MIIFEGSADHKLPIVNNLMKQAGLYLTVGKMLAHSILHGGPPYYGLSPAVIHYWKVDDVEQDHYHCVLMIFLIMSSEQPYRRYLFFPCTYSTVA